MSSFSFRIASDNSWFGDLLAKSKKVVNFLKITSKPVSCGISEFSLCSLVSVKISNIRWFFMCSILSKELFLSWYCLWICKLYSMVFSSNSTNLSYSCRLETSCNKIGLRLKVSRIFENYSRLTLLERTRISSEYWLSAERSKKALKVSSQYFFSERLKNTKRDPESVSTTDSSKPGISLTPKDDTYSPCDDEPPNPLLVWLEMECFFSIPNPYASR